MNEDRIICDKDSAIASLFENENDGKHVSIDKRNKLNDLSGKEWIQETKSFFYQRGLGANSKAAKYEKMHPAPFSFTDVSKLLKFFTKKSGKGGDTQWRYDAIVLDPLIIPIEIKSPTEDSHINPNSIRQAIENSITIEASHSLVKKATSAVIALMYSNKRSASENMLKDAFELDNIRILLISVIVLSYLNFKDIENKFIEF